MSDAGATPGEPRAAVRAWVGFTPRSAESALDPATGRRTLALEAQAVWIADARGGGFTLDGHGFALSAHATAVRDFWDEDQAMALARAEAAEIVRAATGAARVVVFDHTLRRRRVGPGDGGGAREPARRAHVDQTVRSGPQRVREVIGAQAGGRCAIVNVWRPIGGPALDWPLAVADARSVDPGDLVAAMHHSGEEIYGLAWGAGQRWYSVSGQRPDEVLLLKCWDSDEGVARFAPHAAFEDPTTPPGTPPRESIEFRTLAVFE